jgi:hypothetical protein
MTRVYAVISGRCGEENLWALPVVVVVAARGGGATCCYFDRFRLAREVNWLRNLETVMSE